MTIFQDLRLITIVIEQVDMPVRGVMSKAIRILGTRRTSAIAIGRSMVQQKTRI